jgi:alkylation response protein AidB-like acyl-CoA dehydrogenase
MRIDPGDELLLLAATTRRFLETTCPLSGRRLLGEKNSAGFDREWWRRGADLGWTSLLVPEHVGGGSASGCGIEDLAAVAEETGRLAAPGPLLPTNVVAAAIGRSPTPSERSVQVLQGLLSGSIIAAWAVDAPDRSGLPAGAPIKARPRNGDFLISGVAAVVESGADAEWLLVSAGTGSGASLQFLVPANAPGLTAIRLASLDLVRRYAEVRLEDVVAPAEAVLHQPAVGNPVGYQMMVANLIQCAEMAGAASRVFELTMAYAADRYAFGRPLGSYQVIKHHLADMRLWLEASWAALDGAAHALSNDDPGAPKSLSVAKSYVGDRATQLIQDCIQIHGGIGVTWEHDLHLYLRRVTTHRQLFGSPSFHRQKVADLLGC